MEVDSYVRELYELLLRRAPEADAFDDAIARLESGRVSRATLAHELVSSSEFVRLRALDDGLALALRARLNDERPRGISAPPGTDERVVEIPWVLARYRGEPRVLDVGYANAESSYLSALAEAAPRPPTGVDLAQREVPGLSGVVADVRRLPFERGSFDVVFCVSTLEHVGKDNRVYGIGAGGGGGIPEALDELRRVVARDGRVLLTVPAGDSEDRDWFVQRDARGWLQLFVDAGFAVHEQELYELGPDGWTSVEALPAGLRYGARGPGASAVLCVELRPGRIRQAVRRRAARLLRR